MPTSRKRMIYLIAALVLLLPAVALAILSALATAPKNLGVVDGRLAACPDSPNCVSTQATDGQHRIEPMAFEGSKEEAMKRLKAAIGAMPRMKIVTETSDYVHAEAMSLVFRFVDDVEFLVDPDAKVIHFRSASRVGHSALGPSVSQRTGLGYSGPCRGKPWSPSTVRNLARATATAAKAVTMRACGSP